jgi:hypothetical protein
MSSGCPEGKKCEKDGDGNEYYIEDGKRVYVRGEVGTVNVTAVDTPVTVRFEAPIIPKVIEKTPWWKTWITRPIVNGAKAIGSGALKVGGAVLFILTTPTSTGCGADPGMISDGNGGCMRDPNRVDQDTGTGTKNKDDDSEKMVPVFRVFGGQSQQAGFSWTPVDPRTVPNFRDAAGLPPENTGEFLVEGVVRPSDILIVRPARPIPPNRGGLTEYVINPANVRNQRVSPLLPPY